MYTIFFIFLQFRPILQIFPQQPIADTANMLVGLLPRVSFQLIPPEQQLILCPYPSIHSSTRDINLSQSVQCSPASRPSNPSHRPNPLFTIQPNPTIIPRLPLYIFLFSPFS
ncbi:hypothetical protein OCU04_009653 [Sclerotinia nivalis]|uniref:Uncharacterized protein n=1 Tax=Sclerotinia nivalis TaxID=352851 RepID=A0A9X0DIC2_9HELO|nr:hypothetical protein OCU04_009653 [Sclerotinia nivalis]